MTLLYTDPLFQLHQTGPHPERPQRLAAITERLAQSGLAARCTAGEYAPIGVDEVARTHAAEVIGRAKRACEAGGGRLDADTPVSPESFAVALAAAGACCAAVDAVLDGKDRNALCLVRPPGHHATPTRSMGFCLFNNVALAANRARERGLSRVLIIDWDVHHGNGTQDLFYSDGGVTFLSAHRYGWGFYPGTGDAAETGTGRGLGHIFNVPFELGVSRRDYHGQFERALNDAAAKGRPEFVLISAGFDAHRDDPIGGLDLECEDFGELTRLVLLVADAHCGGRVVSCLEGGYDLDALAGGVEAHLSALLGAAK